MKGLRKGFRIWVASLGLTVGVGAGELVEVIHTSIGTDPSSLIPGGAGERFRDFGLNLAMSPSGNHWIFKAFDTANLDYIMVGSGTVGTFVAREGDPFSALPEDVYGFMDSDVGINDSGTYVFGNRIEGRPSSGDESIFKGTGGVNGIAVLEGEAAPGLSDPVGVSGDELYGNSLNSAHILNDGRVAFHADLIQNIGSDYRSALYRGEDVVTQENVAFDVGTATFYGYFSGTFANDATGDNWTARVDVQPGFSSTFNVTVNGDIPAPIGVALPGFVSPVESVFTPPSMGPTGDWFVRGDNVDQEDWVLRSGTLLATTGDPIFAGATETWSDAEASTTFFVSRSNGNNDYILGGATDNEDLGLNRVIVVNGEFVAVREGDPVDVDGNGMADDDVFIDNFKLNDCFLSDDNFLYMFVDLRNGAGTDVGDGFLRVAVDLGGLLGDMNCDGTVSVGDINPFVLALTDPKGYAAAFPDCDILNGDCSDDGQVSVGDINCFVALVTGG